MAAYEYAQNAINNPMAQAGCSAVEITKTTSGSVQSELYKLEGAIKDLCAVVDSHGRYIAPVLGSQMPTPQGNEKCEETPQCDVAEQIAVQRRLVVQMSQALGNMTTRLMLK